MTASTPRAAGLPLLPRNRIILLATVAVLGAGIAVGDYGFAPKGALFAPAYAQAQTAQQQRQTAALEELLDGVKRRSAGGALP